MAAAHPGTVRTMGTNLTDDVERVVWTEVVDGIATITLDSQSNRNALSRRLVAELHEGLDTRRGAERPGHRPHPPGSRVLRRRRPQGTLRRARRLPAVRPCPRTAHGHRATDDRRGERRRAGRGDRADGGVRPRRRAFLDHVRADGGAHRRRRGDHLRADPPSGSGGEDRRGDAHRRTVRRGRGPLHRAGQPRRRRRRGDGRRAVRRHPRRRPAGGRRDEADARRRAVDAARRGVRGDARPVRRRCSAAPTPPRAWPPSPRSAPPSGTDPAAVGPQQPRNAANRAPGERFQAFFGPGGCWCEAHGMPEVVHIPSPTGVVIAADHWTSTGTPVVLAHGGGQTRLLVGRHRRGPRATPATGWSRWICVATATRHGRPTTTTR